VPGKLFYDLRRTAVVDRYNIASETDLRQAADKVAAYVGAVGGG
jgi:hypothetical protein